MRRIPEIPRQVIPALTSVEMAVRVWLPTYAQLIGAARPFRVPRLVGRLGAGAYGLYFMTQQRGASNEKAKERLRWEPRYPSWREGFGSELAR